MYFYVFHVTPSNAMTDNIFDHFSVEIDVKAARAFKAFFLLHITRFFNIGENGDVCSNCTFVPVG